MRKEERKIYIGGDLLRKPNKLMREWEAEYLKQNGFTEDNYYNPVANKSINDKEANKDVQNLCDRIVEHDCNAIKWANTTIFDVTFPTEGTLVEIGYVQALNEINDTLSHILNDDVSDSTKLHKIRNLIKVQIPKKEVFFQCNDIRRVDAPEVGDFRSWSINQYLYGVVRQQTNNKGFQDFETIVEELINE